MKIVTFYFVAIISAVNSIITILPRYSVITAGKDENVTFTCRSSDVSLIGGNWRQFKSSGQRDIYYPMNSLMQRYTDGRTIEMLSNYESRMTLRNPEVGHIYCAKWDSLTGVYFTSSFAKIYHKNINITKNITAVISYNEETNVIYDESVTINCGVIYAANDNILLFFKNFTQYPIRQKIISTGKKELIATIVIKQNTTVYCDIITDINNADMLTIATVTITNRDEEQQQPLIIPNVQNKFNSIGNYIII